jgi:DNA primase large subunit
MLTTSNDPRIIGYPQRLNWYSVPPPYDLSLGEFESLALERLRILRAIEGAHVRNEKDLGSILRPILKKHMPMGSNAHSAAAAETLFEERRNDHVSHFILRLAFCRTADLRHWLVRMETDLFRFRFQEETMEEKEKFIRSAGLSFVPFSLSKPTPSEKRILPALVRDLSAMYSGDIKSQLFFKVPFEKVPELVGRRSVVVKAGYAYVPPSLQDVLVVHCYKEHLTHELDTLGKLMTRLDDPERLDPILSSLAKQNITNKNYAFGADSSNKITHEDIDALAEQHFPLCMQTLHNRLRQEAHLKHHGRLQYSLFLKGIGLPLEEALVFWKKAFHKMSDDQFNKGGYAYNIRHGYGFEGKRTNYTPYSCTKILTTNHPGANEHHGCPFRHYSQDNLRILLNHVLTKHHGGNTLTISANVNEMLTMVRGGHYQVACTRLYEFTHKKDGEESRSEVIEHPNQWFEMSYLGKERKPKMIQTDVPTQEEAMLLDDLPENVLEQLEMDME